MAWYNSSSTIIYVYYDFSRNRGYTRKLSPKALANSALLFFRLILPALSSTIISCHCCFNNLCLCAVVVPRDVSQGLVTNNPNPLSFPFKIEV